MTTIINKSISSPYGVPATAWLIAGVVVNNIPTVIPAQNPQAQPTAAPSIIRMAGFADAAAIGAHSQPLAQKSYRVTQEQVAAVFDGGMATVLAYVLTLPDFAGATTQTV